MDRRRFLSGATLGAALITVPWATAGTASAKPKKLCALNVSSLTELQNAINQAGPGAVITVNNGTYTVPTGKPISVKGRRGTKDQPITIVAQSRGGVTLNGEQSFVFDDSTGVTISGFKFRQSTTLEIPANCSRIRLTRNDLQFADLPDLHWVMVRADNSKIDRNHFHHKTTLGVMLCIEGADDDKMAAGVEVFRNYFSDHTFPGDNGGEPIRLGVSPRALTTMRRQDRVQPVRACERRPGGDLGQVVGQLHPQQHHPEQPGRHRAAAREQVRRRVELHPRRQGRHPDLRQRPQDRQQLRGRGVRHRAGRRQWLRPGPLPR